MIATGWRIEMEHRLENMTDLEVLEFIRDALAYRFASYSFYDDALHGVFDRLADLEHEVKRGGSDD
jgi:hypothetical protein